MSNFANAVTPAFFQGIGPVSFIAANGVAAKVLVEPQVGSAAVGTLPAFYGGSTVIDLTAVSTDIVKDFFLYQGKILTTQDAAATGAMTTTTSTIPRTVGSFITDGWQVGDLVMTFAPVGTAANAAMDGISGSVTAVSDLTLTVSGTPFAALTLAAGTRVARVAPLFRTTITAVAGMDGVVANVALLGNSKDSSSIRTERKLGPTDMLIGAMQAAVGALPAFVAISGQLARY